MPGHGTHSSTRRGEEADIVASGYVEHDHSAVRESGAQMSGVRRKGHHSWLLSRFGQRANLSPGIAFEESHFVGGRHCQNCAGFGLEGRTTMLLCGIKIGILWKEIFE